MLMPQCLSPAAISPATVTLPRPQAAQRGFVPGTLILTGDGALPVEHLFAGDRVAVHGGGYAVLRSVTRFRAIAVDMVTLSPGAVQGLERGLALPAGHPVLMADWRAQVIFGEAAILSPAGSLENGLTVRRARHQVQTLIRLEFDQAQVISANGMWLGCGSPRRDKPTRKPH